MMRKKFILPLLFIISIFGIQSCQKTTISKSKRVVHSLNGTWQLAKTGIGAEMPGEFPSDVIVPGLIDLASPSLDNQDTLYEDSLYWHKTTFDIDHEGFDVVKLKINKAKYHTKVFLNGNQIGENFYNFTPTILDIKQHLTPESQEYELVISVGCINNLPDTIVKGRDFEKLKYIPGIYDDVQLILAQSPFIDAVQIAPDPSTGDVRIVAELESSDHSINPDLRYVIRELKGHKVISKGIVEDMTQGQGSWTSDFVIHLDNFNKWTPESPFLYELELSTRGDQKAFRFGMRNFTTEGAYANLNDRRYFMRGTNVCIFRFFEDPDRSRLPWDKDWVIDLHRKFKSMHWNSIRYCIGFPPQMWYDVADSLGFLIQDEYPLWTGRRGGLERIQPGIKKHHFVAEYKEWMNEHMNHPCVVIWDAQNESVNDITAEAINEVRHLDLSNRPWDNGWAAPANSTDFIESHPYLFSKYMRGTNGPGEEGVLSEFLSEVRIPDNDPNERDPAEDGSQYQNPIIINEYAWLWLNRDGSTTTLTDNVYQNIYPEITSNQDRLAIYAQNLGILTEYWRSHRLCAAVMHFCGLGYSRSKQPRGQTSDNFVDINELTFEPNFYQYVKPSFSPIGLMLELWEHELNSGETISVPVHIINDTYENWNGDVSLVWELESTDLPDTSYSAKVFALEKSIDTISVKVPEAPGEYRLIGELQYEGENVKSIRNIVVN